MNVTGSRHRIMRRLVTVAGLFILLSGAAYLAKDLLHRTIAGNALSLPSLGRYLIDLIASKGLLALIAVTAFVAFIAWHRGRGKFFLFCCAGIGTITAYLSSEVIKLLITQERPCRAHDISTVLACPTTGDWSWPSNHATIAMALAASCVLILPRIGPLVVPIAILIGLARVAGGVHYLHDITSGFALAIIVVCTMVLLGNAVLQRVAPQLKMSR